MACGRLRAMPEEVEAEQSRPEPEHQDNREPRKSEESREEIRAPVEEPAEAEEDEVGDDDLRLGDKARRIIERALLHEAEDGKGDGGEDEGSQRRDQDRPKRSLDLCDTSRQSTGEGDNSESHRIVDEEVFEEPEVHRVDVAQDFSRAEELQVLH